MMCQHHQIVISNFCKFQRMFKRYQRATEEYQTESETIQNTKTSTIITRSTIDTRTLTTCVLKSSKKRRQFANRNKIYLTIRVKTQAGVSGQIYKKTLNLTTNQYMNALITKSNTQRQEILSALGKKRLATHLLRKFPLKSPRAVCSCLSTFILQKKTEMFNCSYRCSVIRKPNCDEC